MAFTEPFLVNPPSKRSRFGFKKLLSKLGNPFRKHRKVSRRHMRRVKRNPLADLMIMNSPKRKHKRVVKIRPRKAGRSDLQMAKKRARRHNAPKKHRLTLVGQKVSRHSRLARHHRGFKLNPMSAVAGLVPSMDILQDVAGVTAGFAVVKLLPKYIFPVVGISETGVVGTISKVVLVVVVSSAVGFVTKKPAIRKALLIGGLVAVAVDLLGQTGVLSDAEMGYILPPSHLASYQIPAPAMGDAGESEDTRR